jgi:hypothetical protein
MEPVDNPVASLISEKPAERFNPAIAFKIFIRVLRARSWVSPVNAPVNTTIIQQNYLSFSRSLLAEYRGLELALTIFLKQLIESTPVGSQEYLSAGYS